MPPDSSPPPGSPAGPVLGDGSVLELYDVTQPGLFVVLSQWDDRASHDAMVRTMGLLWSDYRDRREREEREQARGDVEEAQEELAL